MISFFQVLKDTQFETQVEFSFRDVNPLSRLTLDQVIDNAIGNFAHDFYTPTSGFRAIDYIFCDLILSGHLANELERKLYAPADLFYRGPFDELIPISFYQDSDSPFSGHIFLLSKKIQIYSTEDTVALSLGYMLELDTNKPAKIVFPSPLRLLNSD